MAYTCLQLNLPHRSIKASTLLAQTPLLHFKCSYFKDDPILKIYEIGLVNKNCRIYEFTSTEQAAVFTGLLCL